MFRYAHTNIIAKDYQKLIAFYKEVFRCESIGETRDLRGEWLDSLTGISNAHIVGEHLCLPGYEKDHPTLEIFSYDTMENACSALNKCGIAHLAFEVDDVEQTLQLLLQKGGSQIGKLVKTEYEDGKKAVFVYAADYIVICTNTMHKVAPQIQSCIQIPIIHIAEATAEILKIQHISKVALLGTKYTMTQQFYKEKLVDAGMEVLIPNEKEIELVNHVIYDELCLGIILEKSKEEYLCIINNLAEQGAQGVILGCTEIGLLINQKDTSLPVFDSTISMQIKQYCLPLHFRLGTSNI